MKKQFEIKILISKKKMIIYNILLVLLAICLSLLILVLVPQEYRNPIVSLSIAIIITLIGNSFIMKILSEDIKIDIKDNLMKTNINGQQYDLNNFKHFKIKSKLSYYPRMKIIFSDNMLDFIYHKHSGNSLDFIDFLESLKKDNV